MLFGPSTRREWAALSARSIGPQRAALVLRLASFRPPVLRGIPPRTEPMKSIYLEPENQTLVVLDRNGYEVERHRLTHESLCVFYFQLKAAIRLSPPEPPASSSLEVVE